MDKNYSFHCTPVLTHNEAGTEADNHNQIENHFRMNHTSKSRMWGVEGDHFHTARTYTIDKTKEQIEEDENRALKRLNETPAERAAKRQKLDEEVEELKRHLQNMPNEDDDVYTEAIPLARKVPVVDYQVIELNNKPYYKRHLHIVPNEDDDVYTEATPLARKVPDVDYQIIKLNNKPYYKIIRVDDTHQLYVSFMSLLRNFDREDLEALWSLVKEIFSTTKPKNFFDNFLLVTLGAMFKKPDIHAQIWKTRRNVHGPVKVKGWKLLESCGVQIITFTSTQLILLVERKYPLTRFTLDQMLDAILDCYDDDDDEDYTITMTHKEPDNSLSMGDEHLDTIPATESEEFIKSSVENLVPNPSETEGEYGCDVPAYEYFTTFSNILFDSDYDLSSSGDQSISNEDIPTKIYLNPLFEEENISIKIDLHHFNAESDLIESLLNHDSLIISSSSKIDSLFDEFTDELTLLKSIPPGINETDCDPEEEYNTPFSDTIMSDSEDSIITYTAVSSPFGGLSDIGSLGVGGPPVMPEDPYAYVDDPEEDLEDDPEEDPADYSTDGGDEGDDEDESFDDDEDEDIDIEGDEEEDQYLAPADSTAVALPAIDHSPSAEETEPFEIDESGATPPPHPAYRVTTRIAAARLREPVRDDLYMFVDTVEQGEGFTPAAIGIGYGITDTWDDLSMDASDTARSEVIALRTQMSTQRTEITKLRAIDCRFQNTVRTQQEEIKELRATYYKLQAQFIRVLSTLKSCQTQLTAALGCIQILEAARVPAQPEVPEEAGRSS
nr:hypothetical protein [Tanacetum cinerariifolium]